MTTTTTTAITAITTMTTVTVTTLEEPRVRNILETITIHTHINYNNGNYSTNEGNQ